MQRISGFQFILILALGCVLLTLPASGQGTFPPIRDAFIAERDYIKSGLMILEFTCSEIPYKMVESICRELCEKEFSSLPGHAVLRHNNNA